MDTQKNSSKFLKAILITVRGPAFLSLLSVILLLATIPAQATLLRGYLNHNESPALPAMASTAASDSTSRQAPDISIPGNSTTPGDSNPGLGLRLGKSGCGKLDSSAMADYQSQSPANRPTFIRAGAQPATIAVDSFPTSFAGAWKCITVVVDSAVSNVPIGERIESQVSFLPEHDGRIVACWQQEGWTNAQERINTVSNTEAQLDRTNYYMDQDINGGWAAHSRDDYVQLDHNRICATSAVDQYVDGRYLGQYRTKSMLFRLQRQDWPWLRSHEQLALQALNTTLNNWRLMSAHRGILLTAQVAE